MNILKLERMHCIDFYENTNLFWKILIFSYNAAKHKNKILKYVRNDDTIETFNL